MRRKRSSKISCLVRSAAVSTGWTRISWTRYWLLWCLHMSCHDRQAVWWLCRSDRMWCCTPWNCIDVEVLPHNQPQKFDVCSYTQRAKFIFFLLFNDAGICSQKRSSEKHQYRAQDVDEPVPLSIRYISETTQLTLIESGIRKTPLKPFNYALYWSIITPILSTPNSDIISSILYKKYACYKLQGRGFGSRWSNCIQFTWSFQPHYGPGVNAASNSNE
jgi:hypothetical protein